MRQRLIWLVMAVGAVTPAFAGSLSVNLTDADLSFGLLGGTISNTGLTKVNGDVGAAVGAITGFPPGTVTAGDTIYPTSPSVPAAVTNAYNSFESAWSSAMSLTGATTLTGGLTTSQTLLGNTLYKLPTGSSSTAGITLTFNAQNNANAIFIIQAPGNLAINGSITFNLINGANANNIFWIVGDDATISPSTSITFDGNILVGATGGTFTMDAPSSSGTFSGTVDGCVFSNGTSTMQAATHISGCAGFTGIAPEPASSGLMCLGGLLGVVAWRKTRRLRSSIRPS
jgi:hypothetical protein